MKSLLSTSVFLSLLYTSQSLPIPEVSDALQNILDNTHKSSLYAYPTDFTREVIPKPLHSHNDYWRDVPFYSALAHGAVSAEADVWLINGTLYIGHEESALTSERTFSSLYINPILDTLRRQNPTTAFVHEETRNGVFDAAAGQTLYLFIDFKTRDGGEFEAAEEALQPLLGAKYLTAYNGSAVVRGPVTVIGTGYTALSAVVAQEPRYIFYDAPLASLSRPGYENVTSAVSQIASTSFASNFGRVVRQRAADSEGPLNSTQLELLRNHVSTAHERGILTRYWATPGYPIGTRNAVWRTLIDEGVDLLNVDDLAGATGFWEGSG